MADPHAGGMSGWRPIETAPLDETAVLLFTTSYGIVEARFYRGYMTTTLDGDEWNGAQWSCADDAFTIEVEESPEGYWHESATHWMPLPEPPTRAALSGDAMTLAPKETT